MKKTIIVIVFIFFIGDAFAFETEQFCDIRNLVKIAQNIDNITEDEILMFLYSFDGRCENNVEYAEYSNEILYSLLSHKRVSVLLKVMSENDKLPIAEIMLSIENPVNDQIDLFKAYDYVKHVKGYKKTKNTILRSLRIAIQKVDTSVEHCKS